METSATNAEDIGEWGPRRENAKEKAIVLEK